MKDLTYTNDKYICVYRTYSDFVSIHIETPYKHDIIVKLGRTQFPPLTKNTTHILSLLTHNVDVMDIIDYVNYCRLRRAGF